MGFRVRRATTSLLLLGTAALAVASEPWPFPWPQDRIARYDAYRADARRSSSTAGWTSPAGRLAPRSPRFSRPVRGAPGDPRHARRRPVGRRRTSTSATGSRSRSSRAPSPSATRSSTRTTTSSCSSRGATPTTSSRSTRSARSTRSSSSGRRRTSARVTRGCPSSPASQDGVRPFRRRGLHRNHPRGPRIGYWKWDLPGLRTAVHVDGTLNDDSRPRPRLDGRDRDPLERPRRSGAARRPRAAAARRRRVADRLLPLQPVQGGASRRRTRAAGPGARTAPGTRTSPRSSPSCASARGRSAARSAGPPASRRTRATPPSPTARGGAAGTGRSARRPKRWPCAGARASSGPRWRARR